VRQRGGGAVEIAKSFRIKGRAPPLPLGSKPKPHYARGIMKAPTDLGTAGRRLWKRVEAAYDTGGVEDLLCELCRVADRLHEVRATLTREGLTVLEAGKLKRHPLADLEPKLSGQFRMLWRTAGLADDEKEPARPIGRPPGSERAWRK
jgi:hypothetical protein